MRERYLRIILFFERSLTIDRVYTKSPAELAVKK